MFTISGWFANGMTPSIYTTWGLGVINITLQVPLYLHFSPSQEFSTQVQRKLKTTRLQGSRVFHKPLKGSRSFSLIQDQVAGHDTRSPRLGKTVLFFLLDLLTNFYTSFLLETTLHISHNKSLYPSIPISFFLVKYVQKDLLIS